jgi:phage repressor protein C with HTH and peptisase S24 domain
LLNINKQSLAVLNNYRDATPNAPPTPTAHPNENNNNETDSDEAESSNANAVAAAVENLAVADAGNYSFFNTLTIVETLNPLLIQPSP